MSAFEQVPEPLPGTPAHHRDDTPTHHLHHSYDDDDEGEGEEHSHDDDDAGDDHDFIIESPVVPAAPALQPAQQQTENYLDSSSVEISV